MKITFISVHYLKLIIKQPRRMACIGSPARLVGGWLVMYPLKSVFKG